MVGGTFTIGVCPTPTPTPAPTCVVSVRADTVVQVTPAPCATPVVTPTPKSTSTPVASTSVKPKKTPATTSIAGGSDESDSNSIPLFPLFICLILGGIGVGVTLMVQRRAAH
ncbi:MAG TPA: hypothetical protein VMR77_04305 [Patescibacteria group bacterium]|nr:hypothetical protein [Patescibacteria group bacterium]